MAGAKRGGKGEGEGEGENTPSLFPYPLPLSTLACENIRFSSLFVAEDVSRAPPRETSSATKSEEKRMFSQAISTPATQAKG